MTPQFKKVIGILTRLTWVGVCVFLLVAAERGYIGKADPEMEEGLAAEMIVLGLPTTLACSVAFALTGLLLERLGLALPGPSRAEMFVFWLIFLLAGYFQWFLAVPWIARSLRKREQLLSEEP